MYHLDLAFCPLDERRAIVCPAALDAASAEALLALVPEPLVLTEEEALTTFAANSVVVPSADGGPATVVMPACPDRVRDQLEDWGFTVELVDVSEFHKGGGSIRCLTNPVDIQVSGASQLAQDAQPIRTGKHDVEHHEIRSVARQPLRGRRAVGRLLHPQAVKFQIPRDNLANHRLVVDDEHRCRCGHRRHGPSVRPGRANAQSPASEFRNRFERRCGRVRDGFQCGRREGSFPHRRTDGCGGRRRVVSAAVALGVGEAVTGLEGPGPSLVTAVGTEFIDRFAASLKDLAVRLFGTNDKPALVVGIVFTSLLLGAVSGIAAACRFAVGVVGFVAFGAVGLWAYLRDPLGTTGTGIVAAVAAVAAGVASLAVLLRLAARTSESVTNDVIDGVASGGTIVAAPPTTMAVGRPRRREFLIGAAVLGVGATGTADRPSLWEVRPRSSRRMPRRR